MSGSKILKSGQNGVFVYAKGVATVNKCEILGSGNVGVIICEGSSAEVLSLSLSVSLSLYLRSSLRSPPSALSLSLSLSLCLSVSLLARSTDRTKFLPSVKRDLLVSKETCPSLTFNR
jgi:hypothetical protein